MHITLKKNGLKQQVKSGFSWTTLFFGVWVPIMRGMWAQVAIMFFTCGFAYFYYIFTINRIYARKLIEDGWEVSEDDLTMAQMAWGVA